MSAGVDGLIVARLQVYDDLAEETFTVKLEDVVSLIEGPSEPGTHRAAIISLVNEHLLESYPHIGEHPTQELSVGIEEYSDLKIEVAQKLLLRISDSEGPVN